ncbi:MAG: hypothetical protein L0332_34820 [Chloroflexi bacterium]|nr:hypothetical protein [Chloroflexota bacterium]MCI0649459.1 hypothetical protein [Chloroflexota bacterium]MCI0731870.1 hypothetical protein [Chloroflexota bacterium]
MTLPLSPQSSALIPIFHWRGARPWLLDLDSYQSGWAICLVLVREGDCCLLPVAWQQDTPALDDDDRWPSLPALCPWAHPTFHADALDHEALNLTLAGLRQEGWHVSGRLDVHFHGHDTTPDFWPEIHAYLWQPGPSPAGNPGVYTAGSPPP